MAQGEHQFSYWRSSRRICRVKSVEGSCHTHDKSIPGDRLVHSKLALLTEKDSLIVDEFFQSCQLC